MKQSYLLIALVWLGIKAVGAQPVLDQYIQEGFKNNQGLQQQQIALDKSLFALKEAKALFLPQVAFATDYFLAGGGRTVDFPAGDLLNPVYSTLNQLTNSGNFPQLENQQILLNPNNFYDAKFRTTLPLFNLEIAYNARIKREQLNMQTLELALYKRELAKDIKSAYFNYLQALEAVQIYELGLNLVRESKRINEVLFQNDKVNRTAVLRAENEISKLEAQREGARQTANSAQAYFNFLLNRPFEASIAIDSSYRVGAELSATKAGVSQREELLKLQLAGNINQQLVGLSKSYWLPKLNTFLDLGSQGFEGKFDAQTRYYFFGLSLQWNLFSGGRNQYKVKQLQLDQRQVQLQSDYVENQLNLQLTTALNDYKSALFSYEAAKASLTSTAKFYADVLRLYKEGQVLFIELLDAQNQWLQAQLQVNISLYNTYVKAAEIERANASFNLNQ